MQATSKLRRRCRTKRSARLPQSIAAYLALVTTSILATPAEARGAALTGDVVDQETGQAIPARVYVQNGEGEWLFVESVSPKGSALAYREQWVPMPNSVERHTTISAHPFRIQLEPGVYRVHIERGKEYLPLTREVRMEGSDKRVKFALRRWINMAERGWYSGETHVHRRIRELPNVQLAEDLNVSFPVTFWTIRSAESPGLEPSPLRRQGPSPFGPRRDEGNELIHIDATHVIYPRNTEYEIFSIGDKRHVLGAIFILNHKRLFQIGAPPVKPIAEIARRDNALLDLDKHSWPWSMMLVPIAKVNLYELANNSLWRTQFGFRGANPPPPDYMKVERNQGGLTELGWIQYGLQNYYALLNCGFPIQPTAGTASGVHPVPLGFGRVYVHTPQKFSGDNWIEGLRQGRSFVTTEPMLLATVDGRPPGAVFQQKPKTVERIVRGEAIGPKPLDRIEVIVNGLVAKSIEPKNEKTEAGAFRTTWNISVKTSHTSWIAVRAFRQAEGRVRFAHTAPWRIQVGKHPMRPRREEIDFLIQRVEDQIQRNRGLLAPAALAEFEEARTIYREIAKRVTAAEAK